MEFYYTIQYNGKDFLGNYIDQAVASRSAQTMSKEHDGIFKVYYHKDNQLIPIISFYNGEEIFA